MKNKKEKINQLIEKLEKNNKKPILNREKLKKIKDKKIDNLKIIGVTGSRGKSTVAYLLHSYLKQNGYKSVLYSSIMIDSYLSYKTPNEAVENPFKNSQMLLDAIEEAVAYAADYLILEVNERAIFNELTKDVPFDIRILTNIYPKQNELYEDYVSLKKNFLKEAKDEEILVLGVVDKDTVALFHEFKDKNVITYSSEYLVSHYGIDSVDYLIQPHEQYFDSIHGLKFEVKQNQNISVIQTPLFMPYQAFNITCVKATLEALKVYKEKSFLNLLSEVVVPGCDEVVYVQNRTIIVSLNLAPQLEILKKYQNRNEIHHIIVVTGSTGSGYKNWTEEFDKEKINVEHEKDMAFAYQYISEFANQLYITITDIGANHKKEFLEYQVSLVENKVSTSVIDDRYEAIKTALLNSQEGDVIYISGRGNRRVMCISQNEMTFFVDIEQVKNILKEIQWW